MGGRLSVLSEKAMKRTAFTLAKITRPSYCDVFPRKRLFQLMDRSLKRPILWLSAPAGSGKTTTVSCYIESGKLPCLWYQIDGGDADAATFFSFMGLAAGKAAPRRKDRLPLLTPEYLQDVQTFSLRYFENLYNRLTSPSFLKKGAGKAVVVFDNYHEVPANSPFHEILRRGLEIIPEGVHFIFISRNEPPPAFARLQAGRAMTVLRQDELRLTPEETAGILRIKLRREHISFSPAFNSLLYHKTGGWAAGVTLMLEQIHKENIVSPSLKHITADTVFNYFHTEIFGKLDPDTQDFLLKTALFPSMDSRMAGTLTGLNNAGKRLSELNMRNCFTERRSLPAIVYQYHPLFREFLLSIMPERFGPEELRTQKKKAAEILEDVCKIEDAARLFCGAGEWEGIIRMVKRHAMGLLREGRNSVLREWLNMLPAGITDKDAWLLYWTGMCSFPFDMPSAREYLEKALEAFKSVNDSVGIYLSWAGIVDTYAFELEEWKQLDNCIARLKALRKSHPSFPSKELELIVSSRMLIALTLRKTDQPDIVHRWLERVSVLLQENPSVDIQMDTLFFMSIYYIWRGEYARNTLLFEKTKAEILHSRLSPLAAIRMKMIEAVHYWVTGQYAEALNTVSEGLSLSDKSGVHLFDFLLWCWRASTEILLGEREAAEKSLKLIQSHLNSAKTLDLFYYHINSAWHALITDNIPLASEHLMTISEKVERMGTPYYWALWNIGMAQAAFLQGHTGDAKTHLHTAHLISLNMQSRVLEWFSLLTRAYFLLQEGRERDGLVPLRKGLELGKRHGYVNIEFCQPSMMRFLYSKALEKGIEKEYVKGLFLKCRALKSIEPFGLTPKEKEVVCLLTKGKSNAEICRLLGIQENTVKNHLKSIFDKLGVDNRTAAALKAAEMTGLPA